MNEKAKSVEQKEKSQLLSDMTRAFKEAPKSHKTPYLAYLFSDRTTILVCKN